MPPSATTGPTLDCSEPSGYYITVMEVVGRLPITYNPGANKRRSYRAWVAALDVAARDAAARARPAPSQLFSLRCELRLYTPDQGSDRGDERVDHLDLRRQRVESKDEAGVLAEVWALH